MDDERAWKGEMSGLHCSVVLFLSPHLFFGG
jgi:hypothetical protein